MNSIREILAHVSPEGKELLGLLQKRGPMAKNDIAAALKTNFTTINRFMQPLEDRHLVAETGIGESSGGRKPVLYDLNRSSFYLLGIDISRPYTRFIITDPKLRALHEESFSMDVTFTPEKTAQTAADNFMKAAARLGLGLDKFAGMGLGTVGPLNRSEGVMLRPMNFAAPGWAGINIKSLIEQKFRLPAKIDNGANTAILAEQLFGIGKGRANVAYFHCSTGIRTAVISGGKIVRSINDAEDAFGHMMINVDDEPCSCGNYGCIDCYASIHAIERRYRAAVKRSRASEIAKPIEEIDYIDICGAAEREEALAVEVIANAAAIFGAGLANCINLLSPGLVILSGPLVMQSELFYRTSVATAAKRIYSKDAGEINFSRGGAFGEDAVALGAAAMVMEGLLQNKRGAE